MDELESGQLESTLLETGNDVADDPALDTVGLTEDKRVKSE